MSKNTNDALGERMKKYENITRYYLSPKSYVLARLDGHSFYTYTKKLNKPFDEGFVNDMNKTAVYLCEKLQNVKFAYVQSDEISILLHEDGINSETWFDNNIQKMASVSSSIATPKFNQLRTINNLFNIPKSELFNAVRYIDEIPLAEFDSRFWTVPSIIEVYNYFIWRQRDCEKNSISSVAQSLYSHKELENKNSLDKQELLLRKDIDWNDYDPALKRGRFIEKITYINGKPGKLYKNINNNPLYKLDEDQAPRHFLEEVKSTDVIRNKWEVSAAFDFSENYNILINKITY